MELVKIKIVNMHNVNKVYNLKRFNYFVGHNGAGKSTILQAIQLALLGYIPGYDKNKTSIFQHASAPEMSVELTLTDANGATIVINRTWAKKGKDIVATVSQPEGFSIVNCMGGVELPIFNFNEFISLSANKLKDWFINILPSVDNVVNWDKELRGAIQSFGEILDPAYVNNKIAYANTHASSGIESVRQFNTHLKEELSVTKATYQRLQNTINGLIHYDTCDNTLNESSIQAEIDAHNARIYTIGPQIFQAAEQQGIIQNKQSSANAAPAESIELDDRYIHAMEQITIASEQFAKSAEAITKYSTELAEIKPTIAANLKIISSGGVCNYTGAQCESISAKLHGLKATNEKLTLRTQELNTLLAETVANQSQANKQISAANNIIQGLKAAYQLKAKDEAAFKTKCSEIYDATALTKELDELRANIKILSDKLVQIKANEQYEKLQSRLTTDMYETCQIIEMLKVWIQLTDVNGIQTTMMIAPFNQLAMQMTICIQELFGDDVIADFNISPQANSFNFGIRTRQKYIPYDLLSSGEKCLFVFALFASLLQNSKVKLPLILIDDLVDHLDDVHVASLFNYLYNNKQLQVIIAGVKPCSHTEAAEFVIEV